MKTLGIMLVQVSLMFFVAGCIDSSKGSDDDTDTDSDTGRDSGNGHEDDGGSGGDAGVGEEAGTGEDAGVGAAPAGDKQSGHEECKNGPECWHDDAVADGVTCERKEDCPSGVCDTNAGRCTCANDDECNDGVCGYGGCPIPPISPV